MELMITPHGQVRCLYEEAFELAALGRIEIARASHVEPDAGGQWWANLELVGGPILGPFGRRSEALAAEGDWLTAHWLFPGGR